MIYMWKKYVQFGADNISLVNILHHPRIYAVIHHSENPRYLNLQKGFTTVSTPHRSISTSLHLASMNLSERQNMQQFYVSPL